MKVTADISDQLHKKVRRLASRQHVTFRSLVEQGLIRVIAEAAGKDVDQRRALERSSKKPFKLRSVTVKGNGLRPELRDAPWSVIRSLAYDFKQED